MRRRTFRFQRTFLLNEAGKHTSYYGSRCAAVALIFFLLRKSLTYIFEEELELIPTWTHVPIFGALTGALCKCNMGVKSAALAAVVGCVTAATVFPIYKRMPF
jgi:hypothetical protein